MVTHTTNDNEGLRWTSRRCRRGRGCPGTLLFFVYIYIYIYICIHTYVCVVTHCMCMLCLYVFRLPWALCVGRLRDTQRYTPASRWQKLLSPILSSAIYSNTNSSHAYKDLALRDDINRTSLTETLPIKTTGGSFVR